jgi:hypothetical protein
MADTSSCLHTTRCMAKPRGQNLVVAPKPRPTKPQNPPNVAVLQQHRMPCPTSRFLIPITVTLPLLIGLCTAQQQLCR